MTTKPKKSFSELWQKIWDIHFVRGALAAISLTSGVEALTDLSKFQFLKAIHALLANWNSLLLAISSWLENLPFIPEVNALYLNFITFYLVFGSPITFDFWKHEESQSNKKLVRYFLQCRDAIGVFLVSALVFFGLVISINASFENRWGITTLFAAILLMLFFLLAFRNSIRHRPSLLNGMLFTIGFLITLETLYQLNTPFLSEIVDKMNNKLLPVSN